MIGILLVIYSLGAYLFVGVIGGCILAFNVDQSPRDRMLLCVGILLAPLTLVAVFANSVLKFWEDNPWSLK